MIIVIILSVIAISGCTGAAIVDPCRGKCESRFNECNHRCGQGILSSVCKEGCTYDYNKCLSYCK